MRKTAGTSIRGTRRSGRASKRRKQKPAIYIMGRKADPIPLNRAAQNSSVNTAVNPFATAVSADGGAWAGPDTTEEPAVQYIGLGEQLPGTVLTQDELDFPVDIRIEETSTMDLFFMPSVRVSAENKESLACAQERNADFATAKARHIEQADKFQRRSSQTIGEALREKAAQTEPTSKKDLGVLTKTYDIFDAYNQTDDSSGEAAEKQSVGVGTATVATAEAGAGPDAKRESLSRASRGSQATTASRGSMRGSLGMSSRASGMSMRSRAMSVRMGSIALVDLSDFNASIGAAPGEADTTEQPVDPAQVALAVVLGQDRFRTVLDTMERAVINNAMHDRQMQYRAASGSLPSLMKRWSASLPKQKSLMLDVDFGGEKKSDQKQAEVKSAAADDAKAATAATNSLNLLWEYKSPLVEGLSALCMAWNKSNTDLVAVGYGRTEFGNKTGGIILFWSVKNPLNPCKVIKLRKAATSLSFCTDAPYLLSAGLYDGSVQVFDVRDTDPAGKPTLESEPFVKGKKSKHSEAVWGMRWVKSGGPGMQMLTSVSSDGSVLLWNLKKGLEPKQIMNLKRVPNTAVLQANNNVDVISRDASALCIDFVKPAKEQQAETIYMVGTEGGLIHKCSTLYSEQTLENYHAHTGPVYNVRCSPFSTDIFLSSSADTTICLWDSKASQPVLHLKRDASAVNAVAWSPTLPCVFASVSRDAGIKLWDLESSTILPAVQEKLPQPAALEEAKKKSDASPSGSPRSPGSVASGMEDAKEDETPAAPEPLELVSVSFSPTGNVILAGGSDGSVRVYRVEMAAATGGSQDGEERLMRAVGVESGGELA